MNIHFADYDSKSGEILAELIFALYREDPEGEEMNADKISKTIDFFQANPQSGQIICLNDENRIVGYAILLYYWSNEYGGLIQHLDEFYISPEYRNQHIGTDFIHFLKNAAKDTRAIFLDVHASNPKALNFYLNNGFSISESKSLYYIKSTST